MWRELSVSLGLATAPGHRHLGAVIHMFSHTHHHYHVWHVKVGRREEMEGRWVNDEELLSSAISTGVKKVCQKLRFATLPSGNDRRNFLRHFYRSFHVLSDRQLRILIKRYTP